MKNFLLNFGTSVYFIILFRLAFTTVLPSLEECGVSTSKEETSRVARIVGGTKYEHGEYPWLVAMGSFNKSSPFKLICGGTLITKRHVISASHCFRNESKTVINTVILGEHSLLSENEREAPLMVGISESKNPDYDTDTYENDIQLVVLDRDVTYTNFIRPICLPLLGQVTRSNLENEMLVIAGWGATSFGNFEEPDVPLKALVPYLPIDQCTKVYPRHVSVNGSILCLGGNGNDACLGDGGSPAIYRKGVTNKYFLAGISSLGEDCGKFPGVYTFVPDYLKWIQNNL